MVDVKQIVLLHGITAEYFILVPEFSVYTYHGEDTIPVEEYHQ